MSEWIKAQVPSLTDGQLIALVADVERRIGSHMCGGNVSEDYVNKQRGILDAVQEELTNRTN